MRCVEVAYLDADVTDAKDVVLTVGVIGDRPRAGSFALEQLQMPAVGAAEHGRFEVEFWKVALQPDLEIECSTVELDLSSEICAIDAGMIEGEPEFRGFRAHRNSCRSGVGKRGAASCPDESRDEQCHCAAP